MVKSNRILITGACGSVGSALVDKLLKLGFTVCAFDNDENGLFSLDQKYITTDYHSNLRLFVGDIRDRDRLFVAFEGVCTVYHCAALKHVYLSEYNAFEATQTNIIGTNNVIVAAVAKGVSKVVYTSSDKAVNPTSTMGATKLLGERLITAANHSVGDHKTLFSSVRFGNVLNTNGSVLHIFKKQSKAGIPLTITSTDMTRFFLSMSQALELCLYANDNMVGGEIFIRNMGACSIMSLARAVSLNEHFDHEIIGHKAGEKLYEELVTDSEALRTLYQGSWFIILPDRADLMHKETIEGYDKAYGNLPRIAQSLRSDTDLMDDTQVKVMLKKIGII